MRKLLLGLPLLLATAPAHAAEIGDTEVAITVGVDYVSQYVFRGVSLADDAIQPYVELGFGNFTVGTWFSTGIGETSEFAGDEIDFYASYGFEFSPIVSGNVGITYYHYPQGGGFLGTDDGGTGSYEVSGGVGFDVALAPSATAYYDFTLETFTLEGALGHSLGTGGSKGSFDLGLVAGLVDGDGFSYEYGTVTAGLSYPVTDDASVSAGINYTLSSEDSLDFDDLVRTLEGDDDLFWAGVGISAGF